MTAKQQQLTPAHCPPPAPAVTPDYVLNGLREVVERCLQRYPATAPRDVRKKSTSAASPDISDTSPDASPGGVWRFEPQAATRALELLGKHFGLFGKPAARNGDASGDAPGDALGDALGDTSGGTPGNTPDGTSGDTPGGTLSPNYPNMPRTGVLITPGLLSEEAWEKAARP